jgi:hypothetical protein
MARPSAPGAGLAFFLATDFLWAAWRADVRLADAVAQLGGRDVEVTGIVAGLAKPPTPDYASCSSRMRC